MNIDKVPTPRDSREAGLTDIGVGSSSVLPGRFRVEMTFKMPSPDASDYHFVIEFCAGEPVDTVAGKLEMVAHSMFKAVRSTGEIRGLAAYVARVTTCLWTVYGEGTIGMYETECGNSFEFDCGTIEGNEAKFCLFCGRAITQGKGGDHE